MAGTRVHRTLAARAFVHAPTAVHVPRDKAIAITLCATLISYPVSGITKTVIGWKKSTKEKEKEKNLCDETRISVKTERRGQSLCSLEDKYLREDEHEKEKHAQSHSARNENSTGRPVLAKFA